MNDLRSVEAAGVWLRRARDRTAEIEALAEALSAEGGGRAGLDAVLSDLNRTATAVPVPAPAARWGFRWNDEDGGTERWWPQGVTTTADRGESEVYDGRRLLLASWYAKEVDGVNKGSRISVATLSGPGWLRYRHVLLVHAVLGEDGSIDVRPFRVHAGGLAWHGDHLYVAGTTRGVATFHADDIMRVGSLGDRDLLGVGRGSFGYRYLLPARSTYATSADDGVEPLRFSFLSIGQGPTGRRLVVGEYGRGDSSTRLAEFALDPDTSLLRASQDGAVRPLSLSDGGLDGMQGATVVDGRWYVTTSAGRFIRGSMHVGRPGSFLRRPLVLPVGVEDLSYSPGRDELWSLSEYPGRRFVFAMDRAQFG